MEDLLFPEHQDTTQPSLGTHPPTDNQRACGRPRLEMGSRRLSRVILAPRSVHEAIHPGPVHVVSCAEQEGNGQCRILPAAHISLYLITVLCFCIMLPVTRWLGQGHPAAGRDSENH